VDNRAGRSAELSVRNVPNTHRRNRVRRKVDVPNTVAVVAHNRAAAVICNSRPAVIGKVATNVIFQAAPPATSGVSVHDNHLAVVPCASGVLPAGQL